jgi:asparagine synthase (glutamine-hydrolysing)
MFGCQHTEVPVTAAEAIHYLTELIQEQDEPLGDPACLPMHFVSRAAHEAGIKVVLVGEGSDEVFCGYPVLPAMLRTFNGTWALLRRLPRPARHAVKVAAELVGGPAGRVDVLRRAAEEEPLYIGLDVVFFDCEKARLYTKAARRAMPEGAAATVGRYYDEILERRPRADFGQQMSYVELRNRLPELLLMRVDKFSMAHSLEARAPFLDHQLATYALSLPEHMKMNGTRTKMVLKDAARAWLPGDVIDRPKQGFRVPLPEWLRGDLAPWTEDLLRRSPLRKLGFFDFDYVLELWRRHREGRADHSFDLWCLINLSGWYQRWFS